jgi:hypothetical protein
MFVKHNPTKCLASFFFSMRQMDLRTSVLGACKWRQRAAGIHAERSHHLRSAPTVSLSPAGMPALLGCRNPLARLLEPFSKHVPWPSWATVNHKVENEMFVLYVCTKCLASF